MDKVEVTVNPDLLDLIFEFGISNSSGTRNVENISFEKYQSLNRIYMIVDCKNLNINLNKIVNLGFDCKMDSNKMKIKIRDGPIER